MRDLQYAARLFAKSPGFTLMAVLTVALGVGANTAIFSLVNAVLLRSFPMSDPARIAYLWTPNDRLKAPVPRELSPETADYLELKRSARSYSSLGGLLRTSSVSRPMAWIPNTSAVQQ